MMNIRIVSAEFLPRPGGAERAAFRDSVSAFRRLILFKERAAKAGTRSGLRWHPAFGGRGQKLEMMSFLALWLSAWLTVLLCVL